MQLTLHTLRVALHASANLYDMPIHEAEALVYHEGVPGRHMQIAIAAELEDIPRFNRFGQVGHGWLRVQCRVQ